jgi:putative redox protein
MVKAKVKWVEGLQFAGTSPSNHAILIDGRKEVGGADSAVHPKELLLLALGACTGMDMISILRKMRQEVDDFEIRIEAEEAGEHPKAYQKIKIVYCVKGREIEEEKVRHAAELSQTKYCSVAATLRSPLTIDYDFEVAKES